MSPRSCIILAALLMAIAAAPAHADAQDPRSAAERVLSKDYQTDLPTSKVTPGASEARRIPEGELRRRRLRDPSEHRGGAAGSVVQTVLLVVLLAGLVLVAAWVGQSLGGPRDERLAEERERAAKEPDEAVVARPLGDADELARQGRFGEAIHTLLLRTLEELVARTDEHIPRSLTSREILARVSLGDEARRALSGLIGAVEVSHFGGATPGPADYQLCTASFERFALAYRGAR